MSPHLLNKMCQGSQFFLSLFFCNLEFLSECAFGFIMSDSVTGMGGIELPQTLHWLSFALAERNSKVVEDKFNDSSKGVDGKRPVVILLC